MKLTWCDKNKTLLSIKYEDERVDVIDPNHPDWAMYSTRPDIQEFIPWVPPVDPKLVGVEFEGQMISATAADQNGLVAVLLAIQTQGADFQPTLFWFENGTTVVITLENWQALYNVWQPFRASFFVPQQ